jgi:hypothetical protein
MPRDRDTKAVPAKPSNPFAALASDSEAESDSETRKETKEEVQVSPTLSARRWPEREEKAAFGSPFSRSKPRWTRPRFKDDSDGWVSLRWNQPQFVEETASSQGEQPPLAVTYQPRTPPYYPADPSQGGGAVTPPFELDAAPVSKIVLEDTITPAKEQLEQLSALAWAERIKKSLEKAEQARAGKARELKTDEDFKEALGRLSFFRRGISESQ